MPERMKLWGHEKRNAALLLCTLCFSALHAIAFGSASLGVADAVLTASEQSHPITASTSAHSTDRAVDPIASSSSTARALLQVDSSKPQQEAADRVAGASKQQGATQPQQAVGGALPAGDTFDAYNDYELYTKVSAAQRSAGTGAQPPTLAALQGALTAD